MMMECAQSTCSFTAAVMSAATPQTTKPIKNMAKMLLNLRGSKAASGKLGWEMRSK
jgi:hypothetical protein